MNLLSIRQQFIKLSGRYDFATTVVTEFDTDGGANFFINAGMRFLDRKYQTNKSVASIFEKVASGSYYFTFQNCQVINEVWCNDAEERWQLRRYPFNTIQEGYPDLVSAIDTGEPQFYCPIWLRTTDSTDRTTLGTFFNYVKSDDYGTYNGILFVPPTDGEYVLEVIGKFYHTEMTSNTDQNFWTNEAPETLLKAALYQLEVFYRNTEGANDWLRALEMEGFELEKNYIEQESNEMEVME